MESTWRTVVSVPLQHAFVTQFSIGSEHRLALFTRSSGIEEHAPEHCNGEDNDSDEEERETSGEDGHEGSPKAASPSSPKTQNGSVAHGSPLASAHAHCSNARGGQPHSLAQTGSDPEGITAFEVFSMDSRHSTGPLFCLNTQIATQWRTAIQHNIRLLTLRTVRPLLRPIIEIETMFNSPNLTSSQIPCNYLLIN